jgi:signal transduction histidine kinase
MRTGRITNRIYQGVFYLAAGLIYAAELLRSLLLYHNTQLFWQVLGLLCLFLALFLLESIALSRKFSWFQIYLLSQSVLVSLLFFLPQFEEYDYFSILYAILGMQIMQRISVKIGALWIFIFLVFIGYRFFRYEDPLDALTRLLLFGSIIIFLASYSYASRRAQEATSHNQSLMQQLQLANQQLEQYADTQKRLGVVSERQRLARELHDSVTQTIFSMTLTTQSSLLLLDKDPLRVASQLERLIELTQSAMAEMHSLISELRPEPLIGGDIVSAVRQHIADQHFPEALVVSLEVQGDSELSPVEAQGLFRITQEALNNVVKHADANKVNIHFHLDSPIWIEILDDGRGFDTRQALQSGHLGLTGMHERANEIGWNLIIESNIGEGTSIRVEKNHTREVRE